MIEFLTSIWAYLVGAGVIGLLIGWLFRGVFMPRPKTVSINPYFKPTPDALSDEQRTLLKKAQLSEETLASVHARLAEAEEVTKRLKTMLDTKDQTIEQLQSDLEDTQAEASASSTPVTKSASAAPEKEADAFYPKPRIDEDKAKAEWQNRFLQSRIRTLEAQLADTPDIMEMSIEPAMPDHYDDLTTELASVKERLAEAEARLTLQQPEAVPETPAQPDAKIEWQNKYLRARVSYFEEMAAVAAKMTTPVPAATQEADVPSHELESLQSEITVLKAELSRTSKGDSVNEQELARLRWRNRYLEGRLKYLEAASLDAANDEDDDLIPLNVQVPSTLVDFPMKEEPKAEEVITPSEAILRVIEASEARPTFGALPDLDDDEEEEQEADIDNTYLFDPEPVGQVVEVRPSSFDGPLNGKRDELSRIGGVGPKIEGILNELGIFHFDQIASWTEGEEAWIDSYLRFQGRVKREAWIDQAKALAKAKNEIDA